MSNSRSSRRSGERIATFHVDDEIEISSSLLQNDSLADRVSGAGPPASSLQGDVDLAEVPGFVGNNEPTFDTGGMTIRNMGVQRVRALWQPL